MRRAPLPLEKSAPAPGAAGAKLNAPRRCRARRSPVVRAETLRFKEDGVFGVVKDVFLPWYNAYRWGGDCRSCHLWGGH